MTARDTFERAMALFDEVCDLPPDVQSAALEARCADDPDVRAQVLEMLEQDASDQSPLGSGGDGAAMLAAAISDSEAKAPERIGRFRVVREIGRGGMGVVYEAEQENPRRRIALKLIRQGFVTPQILRRFKHEAQVLGALQHRGIAHIYEAGAAQVGDSAWPYLAMELIDGKPLDVHAKEMGLSVGERLELVARVCDAVQHAHQKGVIHRDVKPGNILVMQERTSTGAGESGSTLIDRIGQPKILDFGVARATDGDLQATTLQTGAGQIVGTLAYMAPEQIDGVSDELDTRCDVYALGVVLYRLLAGRPPLDLAGASIAEAARIIREVEPVRLGSISPSLRGDVETIVAKAMEKDRERRYGSAGAMAEDIRRSLASEPILAHPPSTLYQVRKFAQRNRVLVAGIAATVLALLVGLVGTSYGLVLAQRQRDDAIAARDAEAETAARLSRVSEFQSQLISDLSPEDMGKDLVANVRSEHERSLEGLSAEERAARVDALAAELTSVSTGNLGREVLDELIVERALELIEDDFSDDPVVEGDLRASVADTLQSLGFYVQALEQSQAALDLRESRFGASGARVLDSRYLTANILRAMGRFDEAEPMAMETFRTRSKMLGESHRETIQAMNLVGRIYDGQRRLDESAEVFGRALAAAQLSLGEEHWLTLTIRNNLGVVLLRQERTDEALEILEDLLAQREGEGGERDSERALAVLNNLMSAHFQAGRLEKAEEYAWHALHVHRRSHGFEHPGTIRQMNNLGVVLIRLERAEDAAEVLREAYATSRSVLNAEHLVRRMSAGNLVDALLEIGACAEAEAPATELLETRQSFDPPDAVAVARSLEQLGRCMVCLERFEEAEPLYRECLALRTGVSEQHPQTHAARRQLVEVVRALGRTQEADELARPLPDNE
jgi:serine/threonine protein kinase